MKKLKIFVLTLIILFSNILLAGPKEEPGKQLDQTLAKRKKEEDTKVGKCWFDSLSVIQPNEKFSVRDMKQSEKLSNCLQKEKIEVQSGLVKKCITNSRAVFSIASSIGFGTPKEQAFEDLKLTFREMDGKKLEKYKPLIDYLYSLDPSYILHNKKFYEHWFVFCLANYE